MTAYNAAKTQFEALHTKKVDGQILRSKCLWHEDGEKSSKYFLSLEKANAVQCSVHAIFDGNNVEQTDKKLILGRLKSFYSNLFKKEYRKRS
jgi:hypothetical protein